MVNGQNSKVQTTCFGKNKAKVACWSKQEGLLAVQTSNTTAMDFFVATRSCSSAIQMINKTWLKLQSHESGIHTRYLRCMIHDWPALVYFLMGGMKCATPAMWNRSANSYPWILPMFYVYTEKGQVKTSRWDGLSTQKHMNKEYGNMQI